ncbi:hypothetical protein [Streptomyces sp. SM11]|uniref:hypothetical protein n=1 Tax=Streptomyces sp. SM11 TaxID=565557 RepID=UPI0011B07844|nr:hypothetical protein [Streptomyces sp. SM11]
MALAAVCVLLVLAAPFLLVLRALLPVMPPTGMRLARLLLVCAAYQRGFAVTCLSGSLRIRLRRLPEHECLRAFDRLTALAATRFARIAMAWARAGIAFEGPLALPDRGAPVVVLARHAGILNTQLALSVASVVLRRSPRGIAKRCVAIDPGLRALLRGEPLELFRWHRAGRAAALAQLAISGAQLTNREVLCLFPEGTNLTAKRRASAIASVRSREGGAAAYEAEAMSCVMPPHLAGALAVLRAAPTAQVLVLAHTGLEDLLSWRLPEGYPPGDGSMLRMRWWSFRPGEVPREAGELARWLQTRWRAIDDWILLARSETDERGTEPQPLRRFDAA